MLDMVLAGAIAGIIAAVIAVLITLRLQHNSQHRLQEEQKAWERALEVRQQQWEVQQQKFFTDLEKRLSSELEKRLAQSLEKTLVTEIEQLSTELHEKTSSEKNTRAVIEYELSRLPLIDETPLSALGKGHTPSARWQLPSMQGMDLTGRDFSRRYLGPVDLRGTKLNNTNLFMADLSGASLAGADLSGADLSAANLTNADLRGANMSGANFLLTDLNNAVIVGAVLLNARNLTSEQVTTTIFDTTTQLDGDIDITWPRRPVVRSALEKELRAAENAASIPSQEPSSQRSETPSPQIRRSLDSKSTGSESRAQIETTSSSPASPVQPSLSAWSLENIPTPVINEIPTITEPESTSAQPISLPTVPPAPELYPQESNEQANTKTSAPSEDFQQAIPEFTNIPFPSEDDTPAEVPEFLEVLMASHEVEQVPAQDPAANHAQQQQAATPPSIAFEDIPPTPIQFVRNQSPLPTAIQFGTHGQGEAVQFAQSSNAQSDPTQQNSHALGIQFAQPPASNGLPPQEDFPATPFFSPQLEEKNQGPSVAPASDENQQHYKERELLAERPESIHVEESDTGIHRRRHNGKKRARAN